ncbi:MAG: cupin domain-containing protein [Thermoleophilaceae bacterium]
MLRAGDSFQNPETGTRFEILRAPADGGDVLELRRRSKPSKGKVVPHVHLDYREHFVIEDGAATARLGRRTVALGPGDEFDVAVSESHVNPYNESNADLVYRHSFEPASDFALGYVETLGHLMREGRVDGQDEVPLPAAFAVANATRSRTYASIAPHGLQRGLLFPLGTLLARVRGYELRLPGG